VGKTGGSLRKQPSHPSARDGYVRPGWTAIADASGTGRSRRTGAGIRSAGRDDDHLGGRLWGLIAGRFDHRAAYMLRTPGADGPFAELVATAIAKCRVHARSDPAGRGAGRALRRVCGVCATLVARRRAGPVEILLGRPATRAAPAVRSKAGVLSSRMTARRSFLVGGTRRPFAKSRRHAMGIPAGNGFGGVYSTGASARVDAMELVVGQRSKSRGAEKSKWV